MVNEINCTLECTMNQRSLVRLKGISNSSKRPPQPALDLRLDNPHAAVEALEVFHSLLLDLDRADGGRGVSLWPEPAVGYVVLHATNLW